MLPCFYVYSQEDKSSQDSASSYSSYPLLSVKEAQVYKDNDDPMQEETWDEEGYECSNARDKTSVVPLAHNEEV